MLLHEMPSRPVISLSPDDTAAYASLVMARHNIGSAPVISKAGALCGIITDRDIVIRCIAAELDPRDALTREIMTKSVVCASPFDDVREAARIMSVYRVRRLPVSDAGNVTGFVCLSDLTRLPRCSMEAYNALCEICRE